MQRYFSNHLNNNIFTLIKNDSYHIQKVMRMQKDDLIEIVYQNEVYLTKIIEFDPVKSLIIKKNDTYNELDKKITICQSLVKETKMDIILQKSTELGAFSFLPLKVKNSIIKGNENDFRKKVVRWQRIVKEASEQSKRNVIPEVLDVVGVDELIKLDYDLKLLCTVNEVSTTLKKVLQNDKNYDTMIIVIGPEGGFTKEEESKLIAKGFISISLGKTVLRTETASLCALSMINYELMR